MVLSPIAAHCDNTLPTLDKKMAMTDEWKKEERLKIIATLPPCIECLQSHSNPNIRWGYQQIDFLADKDGTKIVSATLSWNESGVYYTGDNVTGSARQFFWELSKRMATECGGKKRPITLFCGTIYWECSD